MFDSIRSRLFLIFILLAVAPLIVVGTLLTRQVLNVQRQQALELQSEVARRIGAEVNGFIEEVEAELETVSRLGSIPELAAWQKRRLLSQLLIANDTYQELAIIDEDGRELARVSRTDSVTPDDLRDRSEAMEFTMPMLLANSHYGPVRFDARLREPLMAVAVPFIDPQLGRPTGVLVADVRLREIWELVNSVSMEGGDVVYLVDSQSRVVAHVDTELVLAGTYFDPPRQAGIGLGLGGEDAVIATDEVLLGQRFFNVVAERPLAEALSLATETVIITSMLLLAALAAAIGLGYAAVGRIVQPIQTLADTAVAIQGGDLSQQAETEGLREIRVLAEAFNSMTSKLRQTLAELEERVAQRTRAVQATAEISQRLSTTFDQSQLLSEVVDQVQRRFDYYFVQLYLLDTAGGKLDLAAASGEAGLAMLRGGQHIALGEGLIGRAGEFNRVVKAPDVNSAVGWRQHPLLPDTVSEIAVPIALGEQVMGVLDVQHDIPGVLDDSVVELLQSIANQLAIALQNARLFDRAQRQASQEALINQISQKIQATLSIEGVLQVAAEELGQALPAARARVTLGQPDNGANGRRQTTFAESGDD